MWAMLEDRLMTSLKTHPKVIELLPAIEQDVSEGRLTTTLAVERILEAFHG
jgi:LAO/AO transport system kinase